MTYETYNDFVTNYIERRTKEQMTRNNNGLNRQICVRKLKIIIIKHKNSNSKN